MRSVAACVALALWRVPLLGATGGEAVFDRRTFERRLEALVEETERLSARLDDLVTATQTGEPTRAGRETDAAGGRIAAVRPAMSPLHRLAPELEVLHRWLHRKEARAAVTPGEARWVARHRGALHSLASRVGRLERRVAKAGLRRVPHPPRSTRPSRDRDAPAEGPTAAAASGGIAGAVSEDGTFAPLADVLVDVYDALGSYVASGLSAADGTYAVGGLATGSYRACTFNESGYFDERWDDMRYFGACNPSAGTPIAVTEPLQTGGIDFGLARGGTVAGVVTVEGTTTPISEVFVDLYASNGSYLTSGRSGASGAYGSGALPTGTYYACTVNGKGYIDETWDDIEGCVTTAGTAIAVAEPLATGGIDFALAPGGAISGKVTRSGTTTAIAGVFVDLFDDGGSLVASGVSVTGGTYRVSGLASGTYYVCTFNTLGYSDETWDDIPGCVKTSGTPIGVTAPSETGGIDFGLAPGGAISGTVTEVGTGTPLASVFIDVHNAAGAFLAFAVTGAGGDYSVGGLLAGTYHARTSVLSGQHADELFHNFPCAGNCQVTSGTPIVVTVPGLGDDVDFALRWTTGCKPGLVLDGPPVDDVGLVLEGCDAVAVSGPFGVEAPGSITIRAGAAISIGDGFFVENGAACTFEPGSAE
jgi:hypothetical protein